MARRGSTIAFDESLWSAIAEPSRRRLIEILLGSGEATASSLAGKMPISRQAVSKHMAVLLDAGLISSVKKGNELLFNVRSDGLGRAASEMSLAAQNWDRRLSKIKQLSEEIAKKS